LRLISTIAIHWHLINGQTMDFCDGSLEICLTVKVYSIRGTIKYIIFILNSVISAQLLIEYLYNCRLRIWPCLWLDIIEV
jgi:hypothetical protein